MCASATTDFLRPLRIASASNLARSAQRVRAAAWANSHSRLARAFVVARADPYPAGQALCTAEGAHVCADLHQQHGSTRLVDAGDGLQQPELRLPGLQSLQQVPVHACNALFDLLDVLHDLPGHEAVHGTELLGVECLEQLIASRRVV